MIVRLKEKICDVMIKKSCDFNSMIVRLKARKDRTCRGTALISIL